MKSFAWGVLTVHLIVVTLAYNVPSMDMAICAVCLGAILQPKAKNENS